MDARKGGIEREKQNMILEGIIKIEHKEYLVIKVTSRSETKPI
jgi:hypothetical protein